MKVKSNSNITVDVQLQLSESEARALSAITAYGYKAFADVFYLHLGKSCLQPHEAGLKSLFETIAAELPAHLRKADDARKALTNNSPTP